MTKTSVKYTANVIGCAMLIQLTIIVLLPNKRVLSFTAKNTTLSILSFAALMVFSTALSVWFIKRMCDFSPQINLPKKPAADLAALVGMGMGITVIASLANSYIVYLVEKTGGVTMEPTLDPIKNGFQLVLYFLYLTAVTAFCEELLYRGCFLKLMLPYGKGFALFFSSLAFSLMHRELTSFFPTFIMGVFMGMMYLYTESLLAPMALHFVNNAYAFSIMYMEIKVNEISFAIFAVMIMTAIIVAFIAGCIHIKRKKINLMVYLKEKPSGKIAAAMSAPVFIMAAGACLLVAWDIAYGM